MAKIIWANGMSRSQKQFVRKSIQDYITDGLTIKFQNINVKKETPGFYQAKIGDKTRRIQRGTERITVNARTPAFEWVFLHEFGHYLHIKVMGARQIVFGTNYIEKEIFANDFSIPRLNLLQRLRMMQTITLSFYIPFTKKIISFPMIVLCAPLIPLLFVAYPLKRILKKKRY